MFKACFAIFLLSIPRFVLAQSIPLNGLNFKIVPTHVKAHESLADKSVHVDQSEKGIKVFWYSIVREKDTEKFYPTTKVKANQGIVETDSLEFKEALFHPHLWGNGYIRSLTALPLWVNPKLLQLKGRQKAEFDLGLLSKNKNVMGAAPDFLFSQISYFQNLYDQLISGGKLKTNLNLRRIEVRELERFIAEFSHVYKLASTKARLQVNSAEGDYPGVILGNDYFQLVVLDDPLNPLILSFKIDTEKIPRVFHDAFVSLKPDLEFRIAQISY